MRIANIYNHLNGEEYLLCRKSKLYQDIKDAIASVDANRFTKASKDAARRGRVLYDQKALNREIELFLKARGWDEKRVGYFVTDDIPTAKEIAFIKDSDEQERVIEDRRKAKFHTYNQVDFQKDRVAVEVQFGKYFSVAYDLNVKHIFFYMRDEIDVGVEIIPTHKMMRHMDTGIAWFENEVANVIREGRTNPAVPLVIIGIEPEEINI